MNAREPHFTLRTLALLCGALELGVALNAAAAEYVVDGSHPQASDVNPGTAERPWKSIAMANKALAPGDTVYIKAGTYGDFIAPEQSGTAAGRITYRNFKDEQVKIAEAQKGILLVGKSYVTVEGLSFSHLDEFMRLEQASHNAIVRCVFSQMRKRSQWAGARIWKDSQYNTLRQCSFSKWGWYTDDDKGCLLDIGNENSKVEQTAYNLIEGCEFFHGGHHLVGVYSKCNVFRNNYFHNENWLKDDAGKNLWGNRNLMTSGFDECSGRNLFEGNRVAFSGYPPDNHGAAGMGLPTRWNIVRFNCFYGNNSAGLMLGVTRNYTSCPSDNRIYSNTFYKNGSITAELAKALYNDTPSRESTCGLGLAHWSGSRGVAGNAIKNNIFHGNPKPYGLYKVTLEAQIVAGNWEEAGDPLFVEEQTPLDPTNPKVPDLRLRPGSPCVDKGVFLTQVASPDGSGTVFQVADAGYFTDGWNIIDGDRIQLEGSVESARVMKADYETNTLTLDRPLAWKRNQGVSLPFAGAAPDVGAYEVIPGPAQAGK